MRSFHTLSVTVSLSNMDTLHLLSMSDLIFILYRPQF